MRYSDTVAEMHNTPRRATPVVLTECQLVQTNPTPLGLPKYVPSTGLVLTTRSRRNFGSPGAAHETGDEFRIVLNRATQILRHLRRRLANQALALAHESQVRIAAEVGEIRKDLLDLSIRESEPARESSGVLVD